MTELKTEVKRGDRVRITYEGVVTCVDSRSGFLGLDNTESLVPLVGAYVEVLERAKVPMPQAVGTVIRHKESGRHYILGASGRWISPAAATFPSEHHYFSTSSTDWTDHYDVVYNPEESK